MTRLHDYRKLTASQEREVAEACVTQEQWRRQQERDRLERTTRQAMADMEYRAALGLPFGEPLPKALGAAGGHTAGRTALRGTKRMTA